MEKKNKRWNYMAKVLMKYDHEVGAEIGVWTGIFTFNILGDLPRIKKYYCVDLWKHYDEHTVTLNPKGKIARANMDEIYQNFKQKAKDFNEQIIIYRMTSVDAAKLVLDGSLDFVFIDANHAYEYVKEDIKLWTAKVKKGGIISGHDYNNKRFGVTQAVDEIFRKVNCGPNFVWWTIK
jgi:predicted O-methyltransferase YrrM